MKRTWTRALIAVPAVGALLLAVPVSPAAAADTFPSQDACHRSDNYTPRGNCGPFVQLYADDFGAQQVPVGTFSGCGGDGDFKCSGAAGTRYANTLGAYPRGWTDTAGHNGDGNSGPVPGDYRADLTASVRKTATNDGQMRVKMAYVNGRNRVAAMVPLKCMNLRYGKFSERFIVRGPLSDRFKMAHLRYEGFGNNNVAEVDYPEAGSNFGSDPVSLFNHGFDEYGRDVASNSAWTGWHTYSLELTPGHEKAYLDGRKVVDRATDYPVSTAWVLQNESALGIDHVSGPTTQIIDTTWLSCYKYAP